VRLKKSDLVAIVESMLKLTKKADYGLVAMKHLAEQAQAGACSEGAATAPTFARSASRCAK
jgi:hypothetical protein